VILGISRRLLRKFASPLLALLLLLLIAVGASTFIPGFEVPLLPSLSLQRRSSFAHSRQVLREVRPLFSLSTVEYTYKSVFPYDFFPEETDYAELRVLYYSRREIPPRLRKEMELFDLCMNVGIEVGYGSYDFAVITTRIKAGYDLRGTAWEAIGDEIPSRSAAPQSNRSEADPAESERAETGHTESGKWGGTSRLPVRIEREEGASGATLTVSLPEPSITEFIIRDETSSEYEYPDIEITAEEWRRITGYVSEKIRARVKQEGITERAEERARQLIRTLLHEAGWQQVRFGPLYPQ